MSLWRGVLTAVRSLPDEFAIRLRRLAVAPHQPVPIGKNNNTPWCLTCDVMWPCDTFARLSYDGDGGGRMGGDGSNGG